MKTSGHPQPGGPARGAEAPPARDDHRARDPPGAGDAERAARPRRERRRQDHDDRKAGPPFPHGPRRPRHRARGRGHLPRGGHRAAAGPGGAAGTARRGAGARAPTPARSSSTPSPAPPRAARQLVIADTAGRLHNKDALVKELAKIDKIVQARVPGAAYQKSSSSTRPRDRTPSRRPRSSTRRSA